MPAPLSEARMREIARVVATSPTMAHAAVVLGYPTCATFRSCVSQNKPLRALIAAERIRRGRPAHRNDAYTDEDLHRIAATVAEHGYADAAEILGARSEAALRLRVWRHPQLKALVRAMRQA